MLSTVRTQLVRLGPTEPNLKQDRRWCSTVLIVLVARVGRAALRCLCAQPFLDPPTVLTEARFEVTCDVNGCIITPVAPRARSSPAPAASIASTAASMDGMDVEIHEGDGWKLVGGRAEPAPSHAASQPVDVMLNFMLPGCRQKGLATGRGQDV